MKRKTLWGISLLVLIGVCASATAYYKLSQPAEEMTKAAQAFLKTLDEKQRAAATFPYDSPERVKWHFIPLATRKGLQIKNMNAQQREAAHALLAASLSEAGYKKAKSVIALEGVLAALQKDGVGPIRDVERYYVTLFGEPSETKRWGLSFEGHHLSLNFVVEGDRVVSSTPTFYATNPAEMKREVAGLAKGTRVLGAEEMLAFELVGSLSEEQRKTAVIAKKAPQEIRAAGEPQPPAEDAAGISAGKLEPAQQKLLKELVEVYAHNVPQQVAQQRMEKIKAAGVENVHFAWAGAEEPGIGHYYRIQGPTFLIELVNTQPDAEGNPANHVHSVWRNMEGDFALPIE